MCIYIYIRLDRHVELMLICINSTCIPDVIYPLSIQGFLEMPGLIRHLGSRIFRSGPALRDLVQEICAQDKDQAPRAMDDVPSVGKSQKKS